MRELKVKINFGSFTLRTIFGVHIDSFNLSSAQTQRNVLSIPTVWCRYQTDYVFSVVV